MERNQLGIAAQKGDAAPTPTNTAEEQLISVVAVIDGWLLPGGYERVVRFTAQLAVEIGPGSLHQRRVRYFRHCDASSSAISSPGVIVNDSEKS